MWDAAQGSAGLGAFAYPYVHVVRINTASATLLDEPILSSSSQAYAYPGVSVNANGILGLGVAYAGAGAYPSSAAFLRDETQASSWRGSVVTEGKSGPSANEWGDYLTTRLASGAGPSFVATAFTLDGPCDGGGSGCSTVVPRFVWFGRLADYPFPPQCSPRPSVQVAVAPSGPGRLQVTLTTNGTGVFLNSLQFLSASNALIDAGGVSGATGNFLVTLPAGTQQATFFVRRLASGATTVPLVVNDSCGAWPTFVGGGPTAF
jgi:hypothetical protein